MKLSPSFTDTWVPRVLSILRIVSAYMFMLHGTQKLLGFPAGRSGTVDLMSLAGVAGMLELVLGGMLMLGLLTRLVAFILSGEMACAYFIEHLPHSFYPAINDGGLAIILSFGCLYLAAAGGGPISLDAVINKKN